MAQAATSRPPFEPPWMARVRGELYPAECRYSAQLWKSSNTFCAGGQGGGLG